jgi:eukaryotic-like serine/threonine-protein kinase
VAIPPTSESISSRCATALHSIVHDRKVVEQHSVAGRVQDVVGERAWVRPAQKRASLRQPVAIANDVSPHSGRLACVRSTDRARREGATLGVIAPAGDDDDIVRGMLARGQILSGKYRLEEEIGRGGMGAVWRATRLDLGTSLALKVMHGLASDNPSGFDRLSREAKAAASLSSPHVVRVIDFGVDTAENATFIAMELLEGESLAQRLERAGRLSLGAVARVITPLARALSQAHAAGIIHRDLKPANIFLVQNGDDELVKLLDFGVAKAVGALGGGLATATGHVLGTPYYMSPEQVNSLRDIDHRTDIWSLGVIASECLTGRRPFTADTLSELAMKISLGRAEVPSSVAPVPAGFDAWFSRATAVEPARRFQSVTELAAELRALASATGFEPAIGAAGLALATTQRAETSAPRFSAARSEKLETRTAAELWGTSEAALSTTAQGGALSTSHRLTGGRGSRGRALLVGSAALLGVGVFGGALSVFRRSEQPPQPVSAALGSPAAPAEPKVATAGLGPAVATPSVVTEALSPSAVAAPAVAAPAVAAVSAQNATSKKALSAKAVRPRASNAPKAMAKRHQERLDAYDIP